MTVLQSSTIAALGTSATLITPAGVHDEASAILADEIDSIDRACSRFREDSELSLVNRCAGRPVHVSELFWQALTTALRAAQITGGLVDPTVGKALRISGYDRDFSQLPADATELVLTAEPVPGWATVILDHARRTVRVPAGVEVDFGATAKALCADRVADRVTGETGAGVLVSLGGDISTAGSAPPGGWSVGISDNHADPPESAQCTVAISSGGLATSSTAVRRWRRGDRDLHHIIDPRSGEPVVGRWRTASVAAANCVDANIASCAALLLGDAAPAWLEEQGLPARLVAVDGAVRTSAGWPSDERGGSRR